MKERLIELLNDMQDKGYVEAKDEDGVSCHVSNEKLADAILADGWMRPPCKVGETLYFLYDRRYANRPDLTPRIYETNQWYFDVDEKGISILPRSIHGYKGKHHYYLGETVFLTKKEAQKALGGVEG